MFFFILAGILMNIPSSADSIDNDSIISLDNLVNELAANFGGINAFPEKSISPEKT